MIRDLAGEQPAPTTAAVAVIGAGTAGLLLASRIAKAGRRVVVLETGSARQASDRHQFNQVEYDGEPYDGAESGRYRCLGGTSTRWGGVMLPFRSADVELQGWPITAKLDLEPHVPALEALFGLPPGDYDVPEMVAGNGRGFLPRLAKRPSFVRRNLAALLEANLHARSGPEVWLNAHVIEIGLAPSGRASHIVARGPGGNLMRIETDEVVIAAGAIESTRLLFLLDRANGDGLFASHGVLGRYFHDHICAEVGEVTTRDMRGANRAFGLHIERSGMRSPRFETDQPAHGDEGLAAGYVTIEFDSAEPGGFHALREIYRGFQQRRLPELKTLLEVGAATPWLVEAAWWRYVEKRLLFPRNTPLTVNIVVEQRPSAGNRIRLGDRLDPYGQPVAAIDWRVSDDERLQIERIARAYAGFWDGGSLSKLGQLTLAAGPPRINGGAFHPGGTVRMGRTSADAVVDCDLRTFAVPNLSVLSTATFPTAGGANPTMTLLQLALRMADRMA